MILSKVNGRISWEGLSKSRGAAQYFEDFHWLFLLDYKNIHIQTIQFFKTLWIVEKLNKPF